MKYIKIVILIIINLELILSTRLFHRGRPLTRHGMLGAPVSRKFMESNPQITLPKEQWFEQKLDHFNPADNTTWKQVKSKPQLFYVV